MLLLRACKFITLLVACPLAPQAAALLQPPLHTSSTQSKTCKQQLGQGWCLSLPHPHEAWGVFSLLSGIWDTQWEPGQPAGLSWHRCAGASGSAGVESGNKPLVVKLSHWPVKLPKRGAVGKSRGCYCPSSFSLYEGRCGCL